MGGEIVGGAFTASVKPLVQHQTSTLESIICGHHIYKQIWWLLVREMLTLEREEGNNRDKFTVSLLKHATVLGHGPQSFRGCFDTSSGTERPSLVKLLIEESVVKLLPSTSSLRSSYYYILDTFCLKFIY